MNKQTIAKIVAGFFIVVAILMVLVGISQYRKQQMGSVSNDPNDQNDQLVDSAENTMPPAPETTAKLGLVFANSDPNLPKTGEASLLLQPEISENVIGLAFRMEMPVTGDQNLLPDTQLLAINPQLTALGWVIGVNTANYDPVTSVITLETAFFSMTKEGTPVTAIPESIATLTLPADFALTGEVSLDASVSQMADSNGSVIPLEMIN